MLYYIFYVKTTAAWMKLCYFAQKILSMNDDTNGAPVTQDRNN
jgi:hypothetical protein